MRKLFSFRCLVTFFFVFLISFLSGLQGCVEAPNPVGADILPDSDSPLLKRDTIFATSHDVRFFFSNTSSLDKFCIGKYQSYESWGLLGFFGFPDSLTDVKVLSATIRLKAVYHFGDSLGMLSFRAYRMTNGWFGDSLTLDSLRLQPSAYYDQTPLQLTFSQSIGDTDYATISIPDTALVRQWLATVNDTVQYNFGLLLEPTNTSVIMGFASYYSLDTTAMPLFTVEYEKNGERYTYEHQYSTARYLATAPISSIVTDPSLLYVQNGIPYRSILTFDVSSLPNPSIINSAKLMLTLVPSQSLFNSYSRDSLLVTQLNSDGTLSYPWMALSSVTVDSVGTHTYSIDLKTGLTNWVRKRYPARIVIMGYAETSSFDRFALYGENAPIAFRPRLEIVYTTR